MTVTSTDVARAAGVSRATVSYVLNDTPGQTVSPATRAAVRRAADELGYRPSVLARSLKRGRSDSVLFPLPGLQLVHPLTCLVDACTAALAPLGLSLVRDFGRYDDPADQLDSWTRLAPAAVIDVLLHHDDPVLPGLRATGIPVLSAALATDSGWESSGDVFARQARLTQIRYLLGKGHRRITAVAPRVLPVDPRAERRLLADVRRIARRSGAMLNIERAELEDVHQLVSGWTTAPDAVAAHNDDYAIAIMTALTQRGLRVPDDVAVMGIDDLPLGRVVSPALTTIAGDFGEFAAALARIVDSILRGSAGGEALPVPSHHTIVRASA
ncbi:MAG TPA: LacI family DNA-binding transcriptional regulator [Acidimicrobiales bacterium]|nr:LacI family DNA-binding transcriptional regulator [Acidimicrobiales bacterium]